MLEIITDSGVNLDLPIDIQISMVVENPFMAEGRIPLPFSTAFELPATITNLQEFNFPNRLGTYKTESNQKRTKACVIRFKGLVIAKGKLVMQSYDNQIKVNFSGIDFNESHKEPLFGIGAGSELIPGTFNSVGWNTAGNYAYNYRAWAASKISGSDDRFVIAPISRASWVEPFKWADKGRREGGDLGLYRDMRRILPDYYYNSFNVTNQSFFFSNSNKTYHAEIFPQFRVHYLLSQLIGANLQKNPFSVGRLKDLVIPTYYFPKFLQALRQSPMVSNIGPLAVSHLPISQPIINFEDFLPNVPASDFIKEVHNLFCFTLYSNTGGYVIESNTDIIKRPVKVDWSDFMISSPIVTFEEGKVYEYGYQEERPSYSPEDTPVTVATLIAMAQYSVKLDEYGSYEMTFYISETKQYFKKIAYEEQYKVGNNVVKELIIEYDFLGYNDIKDVKESSKTKFSVEVGVKIPVLYPTVCISSLDNNGGAKEYFILPRHEGVDTKSASHSEGSRVREEGFEILLYDGLKQGNSTNLQVKYPFLNPYGSAEVPLVWEGDDGLLSKFHKPFLEWIEKDKIKLQANFLLSVVALNQLDITDKVHVNGRNFYISKLQYTLTNNSISPIDTTLLEV